MSISSHTQKQLCTRSGNKCAKCKCVLAPNDIELLNNIAHICGEKPGSARYNENQTPEERNSYKNLIVLCPNCHKTIDDDPESYTVEYLKELKFSHEEHNFINEEVLKKRDELIDKVKQYPNFRANTPKLTIISIPLKHYEVDVIEVFQKTTGRIRSTSDGINFLDNSNDVIGKVSNNSAAIIAEEIPILNPQDYGFDGIRWDDYKDCLNLLIMRIAE